MRKFGDRYCEMPHWRAILWLYRTPRIHWDWNHLVSPRRGLLYQTIEAAQPPRFAGRLSVPVPAPGSAAVIDSECRH